MSCFGVPTGRPSLFAIALLLGVLAGAAPAQTIRPAPDRPAGEGEGPFERLILRGVTVIDGTGAPAQGPVDIVIARNRIVEVRSVGYPNLPIRPDARPGGATREIDGTGLYVMPGFVDCHVHTGGGRKAPDAEYVYKLWLAHGVTTVRGVPAGPLDWTLRERARSARNEITAPRIVVYARPGTGEGWLGGPVTTPEKAREWVTWVAAKGADGLKLFAEDPEVMRALIARARELKLGTTAHLAQTGLARMNLRDAARLGLQGAEHFYGLFDSLLADHSIQPYPPDYNYNDEAHRFAQVARLWNQIHPRGSKEWNDLLDELLAHKVTLDPTMTIYAASRDVMRARNADWHATYTLPTLWSSSSRAGTRTGPTGSTGRPPTRSPGAISTGSGCRS